MVHALQVAVPQGLSDDLLDMVLEGAEQALAEVDCRDDEPFLRMMGRESSEVGALRLAMAEIVDAYPGASFELESVIERLREVGVRSAMQVLEAHPHLLQVVRLSLEMFFRRHPEPADLERVLREEGEEEADLPIPVAEAWRAHRMLLVALRGTLS